MPLLTLPELQERIEKFYPSVEDKKRFISEFFELFTPENKEGVLSWGGEFATTYVEAAESFRRHIYDRDDAVPGDMSGLADHEDLFDDEQDVDAQAEGVHDNDRKSNDAQEEKTFDEEYDGSYTTESNASLDVLPTVLPIERISIWAQNFSDYKADRGVILRSFLQAFEDGKKSNHLFNGSKFNEAISFFIQQEVFDARLLSLQYAMREVEFFPQDNAFAKNFKVYFLKIVEEYKVAEQSGLEKLSQAIAGRKVFFNLSSDVVVTAPCLRYLYIQGVFLAELSRKKPDDHLTPLDSLIFFENRGKFIECIFQTKPLLDIFCSFFLEQALSCAWVRKESFIPADEMNEYFTLSEQSIAHCFLRPSLRSALLPCCFLQCRGFVLSFAIDLDVNAARIFHRAMKDGVDKDGFEASVTSVEAFPLHHRMTLDYFKKIDPNTSSERHSFLLEKGATSVEPGSDSFDHSFT